MLYFVATPIGNIKEITYRAIEVLGEVDCIFAENPRHSLKLLSAYNIKKPVFEYKKHTEQANADFVISKLQQVQSVAVLSDAGTPLISDPGSILVKKLIENNIEYTLVSGACAAINALVLSGLDTQHFCMVGFLPHKNSDRVALINKFKNLQATLIFYVPVHDINSDLEFLHKHLGVRKAAIIREISKKFEEIIRIMLGEPLQIKQKGEFVVCIDGATSNVIKNDKSIKERLKELIDSGIDKKDAIKLVATELGIKKSTVYSESIEL